MQPWAVATWCIPPDHSGEFVWRMEDVLQTYLLPYEPAFPVVCFDEASHQLYGEVRPSFGRQRGQPKRLDYEYERQGVCNQLVLCEPLRGWRDVRLTARRTRRDYAETLRQLVEVHYPNATRIRLVQDNLNTHDGTSLYETYAPEVARRLLDRLEFHYTPKHGSWLNMAETEIGILKAQCFANRSASAATIASKVAAWVAKRNAREAKIHWTFTLAAARQKLRKCYPSIEA